MNDELPRESEFNSPAEMLTRAMFVGMLTTLIAGVLLTLAGLFAEEFRLALAGLLALGAAWAGHVWLQRQGELDDVPQRALRKATLEGPPLDEAHGTKLLVLLEEWETLEQRRGSAEFDPWALQIVRNDIRRLVESDPALTQLFTELQRAA